MMASLGKLKRSENRRIAKRTKTGNREFQKWPQTRVFNLLTTTTTVLQFCYIQRFTSISDIFITHEQTTKF